MLTAQLRHWRASFRLLQNSDDLAFRKTRLLRVKLPFSSSLEILLSNPLTFREDYQLSRGTGDAAGRGIGKYVV
jgi:hypothetical protein